MNWPQYLPDKDIEYDESVLEQPKLDLLDEKHWLYVQRRYRLTPREIQVAKLYCQGCTNDEIVKALKIRQGTAKTHLRNIYRKIRVKNKIGMLLKFISDVTKLSVRQRTNLPVQTKGPDKKASKPKGVPQKD